MFRLKRYHVPIFLAATPLGLAQVNYEVLPPIGSYALVPWAVSNDARTVLGDANGAKGGWSPVAGTQVITSLAYERDWPEVGASLDLTRFAWTFRSSPSSDYRAYRQSASGFPELLEVPAGTDGDVRVFDMSSDGNYVAGDAETSGGFFPFVSMPVVWDATGLASIPYPTGRAVAVSDDGQTVLITAVVSGQIENLHISPQSGVTSITAMQPAGSSPGYVVDMSGDGTWVIGSYFDGQYFQSFRWSVATGFELIVPSGSSISLNAISRDGSTIVGEQHAGGGAAEAVFWTESTGMIVLRPFLASNGYPAAPALHRMHAVSADGRTFAGNGDSGAFVVSLGPAPRAEVGSPYCGPAVVHSAGLSGTCSLMGTPIVWANDLTVQASDLPPQRFGFFITSDEVGFVTQPGASAGNLCLSGAVGRYVRPGEIQQSDASGSFALDLDLPTTPAAGGIVPPIIAGETRHFQAWFRDVTPAASSNFTSGVSVTFQ